MSLIKRGGKALADIIPGLGKLTFDDNTGTIFITSGTGVIGYRVALALLEGGVKNVRVGVWRGDKQQTGSDTNTSPEKSFVDLIAETLAPKGADIIDFDWSNPDGFASALKGVTTVFCSIPHVEGWADFFPAFLSACKKFRVEHFIKVSFLRSIEAAETYRANVPFVRFHSTCDDLLEQSKNNSRISYTILACAHLMSTPLLHQGKVLTEERKFVTASYGMGVNYLSPNDIADAAVAVLSNLKDHRNKIYNLTGQRPMKDADIARLLSKRYHCPIQHIQLGYHEYKEDVRARGLPSWVVKDSAELERMKAFGLDELPSSYTKDLQNLIGRRPESFEEYLNNTHTMRPGIKF